MRRLTIFFLFYSIISYGQVDRYNQLLSIAREKGGLVVSCNPLKIQLDSWRLKYVNRLRTDSIITDSLITQIIEATSKWDTTKWDRKEFIKTIIVADREEFFNANKLLDEWGITDKQERKKYRKLINKWINTDVNQRPVNYLSRPVLTQNPDFGLIAVDLVTHGLCCGGQINLYKYEVDQWKDLGSIYSWKH
jgi:hypothetical protein